LHVLNNNAFSDVRKSALFFLRRFFRNPLAWPFRRFMLGDMGYRDKLKKLCALRELDQSALASRVGLSKSSMSRILSGAQEPKLLVAYELAKALGVTLDYLVDESLELGPTDRSMPVTEEEMTILKIVRYLGTHESVHRLLAKQPQPGPGAAEAKPAVPHPLPVPRQRGETGQGE
jgi:transcriptional regulator with XRE-family HTH domain